MNRRWEVSEEILGTLVLLSSDATISSNSITSGTVTTTQISYRWVIEDWSFVFNHNSSPGDKWHCTHEYSGDYIAPNPSTVSQSLIAMSSTNLSSIVTGGITQPYLLYSNLSGPAWDSRSGGSGFLNIAYTEPLLSNYWNSQLNQTNGTLVIPRKADPRSFIINNPEGIRAITIMFSSNNSTMSNGWTTPVGQTIAAQGSDFFTAGKHIFTFRKLKFL